MQRRKKVTVVHKANVLRICDGLFLRMHAGGRGALSRSQVDEQIMDAMAALWCATPAGST